MRLRHVILLAACAGAAGALLLAVDIHRRVQDLQRDTLLNNNASASGPGSVLSFGDVHMLGLLALAFLFLAIILLLLTEPKPAPASKPSTTNETAKPAREIPIAAPPIIEAAASTAAHVSPLSNQTPERESSGLSTESNKDNER